MKSFGTLIFQSEKEFLKSKKQNHVMFEKRSALTDLLCLVAISSKFISMLDLSDGEIFLLLFYF